MKCPPQKLSPCKKISGILGGIDGIPGGIGGIPGGRGGIPGGRGGIPGGGLGILGGILGFPGGIGGIPGGELGIPGRTPAIPGGMHQSQARCTSFIVRNKIVKVGHTILSLVVHKYMIPNTMGIKKFT